MQAYFTGGGTLTDPVTGQPVQQIIQTQLDPKTGKPTQVVRPLPSVANNNVQVVTVQDAVTGQMKQQIVDSTTGKTLGSNEGTLHSRPKIPFYLH